MELNRDDVFNQLMEINQRLTDLPLFPSLGWAFIFDIIKDVYDNNQEPAETHQDYVVTEGTTLRIIFDKLLDDIDGLGIDLDMGSDILNETMTDWMLENNFIATLDDDGWLE